MNSNRRVLPPLHRPATPSLQGYLPLIDISLQFMAVNQVLVYQNENENGPIFGHFVLKTDYQETFDLNKYNNRLKKKLVKM